MQLTAQALREIMPLCAHMEIDLVRAAPEEVVGSMEWDLSTTTAGGAMHGGALGLFLGAVDPHGRAQPTRPAGERTVSGAGTASTTWPARSSIALASPSGPQ